MQVLAASIQGAVDAFLHAGYISAYPRTFSSWAFPESAPKIQLEMAEALRLKSEGLAAGQLGEGTLPAMVSASDWYQAMVIAAVCFFGALGAVYLIRSRISGAHRRAVTTTATVMLALLALTLVGWKKAGPPRRTIRTTWSHAPKQAYASPRQATTALLHGIIADAVANHRSRKIRSLAQLRYDVALPLPARKQTRGMKYALRTYGLDGWGRPFRLSGVGRSTYQIRSAGADGRFETGDDQLVMVKRSTNDSWETRRWAFFLHRHHDDPVVLFRRHNGRLFRFRNRGAAKLVTGSSRFDLLDLKEIPRKQSKRLARLYAKMNLESKRRPLVLMVFSRRYY